MCVFEFDQQFSLATKWKCVHHPLVSFAGLNSNKKPDSTSSNNQWINQIRIFLLLIVFTVLFFLCFSKMWLIFWHHHFGFYNKLQEQVLFLITFVIGTFSNQSILTDESILSFGQGSRNEIWKWSLCNEFEWCSHPNQKLKKRFLQCEENLRFNFFVWWRNSFFDPGCVIQMSLMSETEFFRDMWWRNNTTK